MTRTPFDPKRWQELLHSELGRVPEAHHNRHGLLVQPVYHAAAVAENPLLDTTPGSEPFTRGPYASMYTGKPWTIRQYAGFSTAEESNAFFKANLAAGQRGLSVAFDLPTHRGYDSDHPRVAADVGKAGVAVDSVLDMEALFQGIDLGQISVSMTMNGAVLPVLAAYLVAAEEQGCSWAQLRGTVQNDILKEFMVRNTFIYGPEPSMRIVADVMEFCAREMPRFNPISISGYHLQEAGANAVQELAFTLANGLEYVELARSRGLAVDAFAPRLSFFFGVGTDFFTEIAKLRAARTLWSTLMRERYNPSDPDSLRLRMHCQTSGVSLTAREPLNNIVRTTLEGLAAVLGGTQSLHTNSYDEALALPSDTAARVARNTQLILQHETDVTSVVDPLGGSYFVEALTEQLVTRARALIGQMDALGGMVKAIERGVPQAHIERSAAERQVRVDRGEEVVVGVNRFEGPAVAEPEVRVVDSGHVLEAQRARLESLRSNRDGGNVASALAALQAAAREGRGNLLEAAIQCMRARSTVGEVSATLESVWGRYVADKTSVTGVFAAGYGDDGRFGEAQARARRFLERTGRRPRLLVAKLGQDGHDRGAKVIAAGFADAGFDVDLAPLFQTPEEVARAALDHDVHVVGISTQAGAHASLVPELVECLRSEGAKDVLVVCGGIVPERDRARLLARGVAAVFTPGTQVITCVEQVLSLLEGNTGG